MSDIDAAYKQMEERVAEHLAAMTAGLEEAYGADDSEDEPAASEGREDG